MNARRRGSTRARWFARTAGRRTALAAVLALAVGVAACGDSGDEESTTTSSATTTAAAASDIVASAQESIEEAYAGTMRTPPESGPEAQAGKKVWVVSCAQSAEGCSVPANAAVDAAKRLGWDVKLFDGRFTPQSQADGIRQAVAAGADGILLVAVDCAVAQEPLKQAREQGVFTVSVYGFDCDDPAVGGEALYGASVDVGYPTLADFFRAWGAIKADYIIAKSGGTAKVIDISEPDYTVTRYIEEGFAERIAECDTCEVVENVRLAAPDLGNGAAVQKVQAALAKHPDATDVHVPADAFMGLGLAQVFEQAKRSGHDLRIVGAEGHPSNMDLIRKGTETVSIAVPAGWYGWAGIDTLNRAFAGETEFPDSGFGWQAVDAGHNLPESGPYVPPVDFEAAYEQVWGTQ